MAEPLNSNFPEELQPGTIIELGDSRQLPEFEDALLPYIQPDRISEEDAKGMWVGRESLKDLLRPPRFNGRVKDIALQVMDAPLARLLDTKERGFSLGNQTTGSQIVARSNLELDKYIGFKYQANAYSSGRGKVGLVQAELWYGPKDHQAAYNYGVPVNRFVATKRKVVAEQFSELDKTSRHIGFTVLRYNLLHPYHG